jgi:glycosyltransferase involved in cell wall biosynthesis
MDLRQLWDVEDDKIDIVPLGLSPTTAVSGGVQSGLKELTDSPFVLLSPYNLEPRKNLAALLEATAVLISNFPELKLILFGRAAVSPEREEDFERKIRELGIEQCVIRTGIVTDDDLGAFYSRATLFVFPSLYEGFGLPLLEAMFRGACVVARNASAMAEVVGDCGVLVETRDTKALASAIATILNNESLRSDLGRRARERARLFSVEDMAVNTYRSYLTALAQKVDLPMRMNSWPAN